MQLEFNPTFTTRRQTLKLARRGNVKAIAAMLNQTLSAQDILAQVSMQADGLHVMLEGRHVPDPTTIVPFVHNSISRLAIISLARLTIAGQQYGQTEPAWEQELEIDHAALDQFLTYQIEARAEVSSALDSMPRVVELPFSRTAARRSLYAVPSTRSRPPASAPTPLTEPTASQVRLMVLLKVLTAIALLVAGGSFFLNATQLINSGGMSQVWIQLTRIRNPDYPRQLLGSLAMLMVTIAALTRLFHRNGMNLHPKQAQRAYMRLGVAFLVNMGCALVLLVLVSQNFVVPPSLLIPSCFILCIIFWIWSCCALAKAKGYHPLWGIAGILLLDGVVLLSLLPDKCTIKRILIG